MDFRAVFVLLVYAVIPTLGTHTKYLDDYCGGSTTIYHSAVLRLTRSTRSKSCTVTVKASSAAKRLSVRFNTMHSPCASSSLNIYDGKSTSASKLEAACGFSNLFLLPVTSSGRYLTFKFHNTGLARHASFNILLTEFNKGLCLQYSCLNGRCISSSLTCDGRDNCGDDSDELFGCSTYFGSTIGLRVGLGVGATVFVVVVISLVFGLYRRRLYVNGTPAYRNRTTVMTTQTIPPPVTLQMAPPQFQQISVPQFQNMAPTQFQQPAQPPPYSEK